MYISDRGTKCHNPYIKLFGSFSKKMLNIDPKIPVMGIYPKNVKYRPKNSSHDYLPKWDENICLHIDFCPNVYISIISNSHKVETAQMDKQILVCPYNRVVCGNGMR